MTASAWIMMVITWAIIASATIYFFSRVLKKKGD
jgi:hypothetical protein